MITTKPVNDLEELGYNLEHDDGSALIITKELAQQLHDTMLAFVILRINWKTPWRRKIRRITRGLMSSLWRVKSK